MKNLMLFAVAAVLSVGAVGLWAVDANATGGPGATAETKTNKVTMKNLYVEPRADCTWDFPALTDIRLVLATACAETATCNAPGAVIGDSCLAASNLGMDGGAALHSDARLSCRAVTNGVVFQLCSFTSDGGSYDLGDAGLVGRVIH